jgi:hypothetical protein
MSIDVRWVLAAGAMLTASFAEGPHRIAGQAQSPQAVTVVAELFTSEGCSSCPPADDVLSDLVLHQPVPGVEVLALAEHVDYWDRLGWRDRFSSAAFSARQSDYDARVFRTDRIYTPQLVVDGQWQVVGSDAAAVRKAIRRAAGVPKATVTVDAARVPARREVRVGLNVSVPANLALQRADVLVAVVEDNLVTDVRRGENSGRKLRHTGVVRSLTTIGALAEDERLWSATVSVSIDADSKPENLRVIAFLQERDTRRILGAAAARVAA